MNKVTTALVTVAAMGLASQAYGYDATADVTFNWASSGTEGGWTASGTNVLTSLSNNQFFTSSTGANSESYFNPDFATEAFYIASGACADPVASAAFRSQYACRTAGAPLDIVAVTDEGPGASAAGTLTITDTSITGVLTVIPTNDEGAGPQLGTTEATGYNIRSADGSPFKNVWYGVSDALTLNVNLTGTFTETDWAIDGGVVVFNDPNIQCAIADFSGVLCGASQLGDGEGSFRSWGFNTPETGDVSEIQVSDETGVNIIESIAGVLANLSIDGSGNISTTQGEYRRGSQQGACPGEIRYQDGVAISCGTLITGTLDISGAVNVIPVPAAAWLFGSALGLLGWVRRRSMN